MAAPTFKVIINDTASGTFILDTHSSMTVRELKQSVNSRTNIPVNNLMLVCSGTDLEDEKTMADYEIQSETMIHMIILQPGGLTD